MVMVVHGFGSVFCMVGWMALVVVFTWLVHGFGSGFYMVGTWFW